MYTSVRIGVAVLLTALAASCGAGGGGSGPGDDSSATTDVGGEASDAQQIADSDLLDDASSGVGDSSTGAQPDSSNSDQLTSSSIDADNDGLPDSTEDANGNGKVDPGETDPNNPDSDGDGLTDGAEVNKHKTNPLEVDTDKDGLPDGLEVGQVLDKDPATTTNPTDPDTDGDGVIDGAEDKNHDGKKDADESDPNDKSDAGKPPFADPCADNKNGFPCGVGKVCTGGKCGAPPAPDVKDSDKDGLADSVEDANGNGKVDPDETDPSKPDSDGDGLADGAEDENHNGKVDAGETDPRSADTDGDELPDGLEKGLILDKDPKSTTDANDADSDDDGLPDGTEDANHNGKVDAGESDPNNPDTDGEGLKDGDEDLNGNGVVDAGESSPVKADTDGDGLSDAKEVNELKTDPSSADTDKDGLPDGVEVGGAADKDPKSKTDPNNPDTDGDGVLDGAEDTNKNGAVDVGEADPNNKTDAGKPPQVDPCKGQADGVACAIGKVCLSGKCAAPDPKTKDSDGDGLSDAVEDANSDGVVGAGETDPNKADTDGDGLGDGVELGVAGDKDPASKTNPLKADTDGDGLADGVEDANHNGKVDAGETDPNNTDTDGEGLTDGAEVQKHKTNPTLADTDKDGLSDGLELGVKSDADPKTKTDPTKPDTDGDGVVDGAEDKNHNGKVDAGEADPNDPKDKGVPTAPNPCAAKPNGYPCGVGQACAKGKCSPSTAGTKNRCEECVSDLDCGQGMSCEESNVTVDKNKFGASKLFVCKNAEDKKHAQPDCVIECERSVGCTSTGLCGFGKSGAEDPLPRCQPTKKGCAESKICEVDGQCSVASNAYNKVWFHKYPHQGCFAVSAADCADSSTCKNQGQCKPVLSVHHADYGTCKKTVATCTAKTCDDKNPCTFDKCDNSGCVKPYLIPVGTKCGDGKICDKQSKCVVAATSCADKKCADANVCTADACVAGKCVFTPMKDGLACGLAKTCSKGVCAASQVGAKARCEECVSDLDCGVGLSCEKSTLTMSQKKYGATALYICKSGDDKKLANPDCQIECERSTGCAQFGLCGLATYGDGSAQNKTCLATTQGCLASAYCKSYGKCSKTTPPAQKDAKYPFYDCRAATDSDCSASDNCQNYKACAAKDGKCNKGGVPVGPCKGFPCEDNNPCTVVHCDASTAKCSYTPINGANNCPGGKACVFGKCPGGNSDPCAAKNCDDGNVCTADKCSDGKCSATALKDGLACGLAKTCSKGVCAKSNVGTVARCGECVSDLDCGTGLSCEKSEVATDPSNKLFHYLCKNAADKTGTGPDCLAECAKSYHCKEKGHCKPSSQGTGVSTCVATKLGCQAALRCPIDGKCDAIPGVSSCVATSNSACAKSLYCKDHGSCKAITTKGFTGVGTCGVGSDAHCKQSDQCKKHGKCSAQPTYDGKGKFTGYGDCTDKIDFSKSCGAQVIPIDVDGKLLCAPDYPRWGIRPESPPSAWFKDNGDGTVDDTQSKLTWEKAFVAGKNVDLKSATDYCQSLKLGGLGDWRLPTRAELLSIVDYSKNTWSKPFVHHTDYFWSSAAHGKHAWVVAYGHVTYISATTLNHCLVRCVRGVTPQVAGAAAPPGQFKISADTVLDATTGLTWQRDGLSGGKMWSAKAGDYCKSVKTAGGGWRVPTVVELASILNAQNKSLMLSQSAFSGSTTADAFWSSTTAGGCWRVGANGIIGPVGCSSNHRVRCVRGVTK